VRNGSRILLRGFGASGSDHPIFLCEGMPGGGRFFASRGPASLFSTCARGLRFRADTVRQRGEIGRAVFGQYYAAPADLSNSKSAGTNLGIAFGRTYSREPEKLAKPIGKAARGCHR
jgi:hypothetical protein